MSYTNCYLGRQRYEREFLLGFLHSQQKWENVEVKSFQNNMEIYDSDILIFWYSFACYTTFFATRGYSQWRPQVVWFAGKIFVLLLSNELSEKHAYLRRPCPKVSRACYPGNSKLKSNHTDYCILGCISYTWLHTGRIRGKSPLSPSRPSVRPLFYVIFISQRHNVLDISV